MIFTELILENFGPYYGKYTLNLRPETDGESRPIILFGGMNGGGKTTIMDAIRLALYGQRAQCSTRNNLSYSDFLSQSVNSKTPAHEKTRIELAFEHIVEGKWQELRIVRTWTKKPKDGKDHLGILEGDWLDSALVATWDEYIENLLPLGISNLFLFDGEQVKELAEQDTPPTVVIEAIKSLLGLGLADRLAVDLDILVTRKRKGLANASQLANIEEMEAKLNQLNDEKQQFKNQLESLQKQFEIAQKNHQEASSRFRLEGGKIAAESSQLTRYLETLEKETENQRQTLRDSAAGILPLALITPLLEQAKHQGEKELKSAQAIIARDVLLARDERLLNYLEQIQLNLNQIEQIKSFLAQENQDINQDIDLKTSAWLEINQNHLKQLVNISEHTLPIAIQIAQKHQQKLKELEIDINNTERKLAVAASPEAYHQLEQELKEAQQKLVKVQSEYNAGKDKCEIIEKLINQTKKELEEYSKTAIDRQNNEHIINSVTKVQQTLQLFKEKLTLKKLNKLEGQVTECFRYLLHKSDLVHRVAIDTENFCLSLYDFNGQPLPKHRLSAGEKQLLAIAFLWGLARVSGKHLPIAIDTPLGRLDSSHRNHLVERYFPTASHQVILLSTDTEIGETEVQQLRQQQAIAREYLLKYEPKQRQTIIKAGYFW